MVKRALVAFTALMLAGCSVSIPQGYRPSQSSAPRVGVTEIAPENRTEAINFSGSTIHGEEFSLETIEGPAVINAWASWCEPCKDEWQELVAVHTDNPTVSFVGMNEADDLTSAQAFVAKHGDFWPHVSDPDQSIALESGVATNPYLPLTVVLDSQHRIAARINGPVTAETLNSLLNTILAE